MFSVWILFFAFSAFSALILQLVVLPYGFPSLHAGHGLLIGGDWVGFHRIADILSQKILLQGWSEWELRPLGHATAGMAAAVYALTVPEPYVLIPFNAILHATAGITLMQLVRLLTKDKLMAFFAALPFVLFPSSLAWYAQIGKDGFYFAGAFLCLYGWVVLARLETWKSGWDGALLGVVWIGLGLLLMGSVRVYSFQLMQGIGVIYAFGLTLLFVVRGVKKVISWTSSFLAIAILISIPLLLQLSPSETRGSARVPMQDTKTQGTKYENIAPQDTKYENIVPQVYSGGSVWHGEVFARERWQSTSGFPRIIENSFLNIAVLRQGYLETPGYRDAGSMVDRHIQLLSVKDFFSYFPRALQLGFFAPFPSDWLSPAYSAGGNMFRLISGIEMLGVYLSLIFLPYALWHWRDRVELWLAASFGTILLLLYSYATPNIGSLYRLRYGFLMLLVSLGIAGAFAGWRTYRNSSHCTSYFLKN